MTKLTSEAMIEARKSWWSSVCRQGDPMRRPRLVDEAFEAGWQAALPSLAEEPMLTQEETDELVERINANPNLHPLPPAETGDDDAEWLREQMRDQRINCDGKICMGWVEIARLEAIASRLSSAGDDELVARVSEWLGAPKETKSRPTVTLHTADTARVIAIADIRALLNRLEALSRKGRGE